MLPRDPRGGPAVAVLMASVARRYYLEGESKIDIALTLGISRFKVARLLEQAQASGIVRIEIVSPGSVDLALSSRLQEAFALRHCLVVSTAETNPGALRQHVGRAAAELVSEIVTADDVLGLAWARSLAVMSSALTHLAACEVVQLTGALQRPDDEASSTELVREVARVGGGPAHYFYAPMIVADASTADALRRQPEVARSMGRLSKVTKALVGIGSWEPGASTVHDALAAKERQQLRRLGGTAEISGVLIDDQGRPVPAPLAARTIGVSALQLNAIPDVVALAYGGDKARAVRAALISGLVKGLVTHSELASQLLATTQRRGG